MKVDVAPQAPKPQSQPQPQPQQKRPIDKENMELNEKASKIHRSTSSTAVRARNNALGDRN